MLEQNTGTKPKDKQEGGKALAGSNSKTSFVTNKAEESGPKQKVTSIEFKEPKSNATLTFSQVAFLIRK